MLPHVSLMLPQFLWIFFMFPLLFLPISYFRSYNQKLQKLTSYISLYVSVYCNKLMYITLHPLCLKLRKVFFAFVFVFFLFVCLFVFLFCFVFPRKERFQMQGDKSNPILIFSAKNCLVKEISLPSWDLTT